jgi:hypothetical protein
MLSTLFVYLQSNLVKKTIQLKTTTLWQLKNKKI